jgi:hypothetical protein
MVAAIEFSSNETVSRKLSHPKRYPEERLVGSAHTDKFLAEEVRKHMQSDTVKYEDIQDRLSILAMKFNNMKANLASQREDKKHFLLAE